MPYRKNETKADDRVSGNVTFSTQFLGGYRKREVDGFLHDVGQEATERAEEIVALREELGHQATAFRERTPLEFFTERLSDLTLGDHHITTATAFRELPPEERAPLLAIMRPDASAALLRTLPNEERVDILSRLATPVMTPQGELETLASKLVDRCCSERTRSRAVGGQECLAAILEEGEDIWPIIATAWAKTDPDTTQAVREKMLLSEDLLTWSSRGIQMMLRNVSQDDLIRFLAAGPPELEEVIKKGVSLRAFAMIQGELEVCGPISKEGATAARRSILKAARQVPQSER